MCFFAFLILLSSYDEIFSRKGVEAEFRNSKMRVSSPASSQQSTPLIPRRGVFAPNKSSSLPMSMRASDKSQESETSASRKASSRPLSMRISDKSQESDAPESK